MNASSETIPFAGCFSPDHSQTHRLVFAGLPDDSQSSFRRGSRKAPTQVRESYDGRCFNATTEGGVDLTGMVSDVGDVLSAATWKETSLRYQIRAKQLFSKGHIPFFVGGDHAVTVPVVAALQGQSVDVIQIDAHPDLYPDYLGNPASHACTGARLLEFDHVRTLTQVGVRTMNLLQERTAARYAERLHIFPGRDLDGALPELPYLGPERRVYLTMDMDAIDPAFAPGVSHPVPGGLFPRQILNWILRAPWNLVGMDVVEVNPECDDRNRTAILAARILHEAMGLAVIRSAPIKSETEAHLS